MHGPRLGRPAVLLLVPDGGHPARHPLHARGPPAHPPRRRGGRRDDRRAGRPAGRVHRCCSSRVAVMGFMASRWRRAGDLEHLDEWGLGGRKFGSWITWFLLGGDLYTAYTFVAIPALLFSSGALGFYAVPYTIIAFPLVMLPLLRMWSVSRVHGYVTPADFVRGRYDSPLLALAIAITGIVATMPYIALQLAGLEAVLRTIGLNGSRVLGPRAAVRGLRRARRVHLPVRAAGAGADRGRQGRPDLPRHPRRDHLPAAQARRVGRRSSTPARPSSPSPRRPPASPPGRRCSRRTTSSSTPRWRWARRSHCSSTRTRSPACSPARAAPRSGGT